MKKKIDQIMNLKAKTLDRFKEIQVNYLSTIYGAIIQGKKVRDIHKEIRKVTIWYSNLGYDVNVELEKYAFMVAKKVEKDTTAYVMSLKSSNAELPLGLDVMISTYVFSDFNKNDVYQRMSSLSYQWVNKLEEKLKKKMI